MSLFRQPPKMLVKKSGWIISDDGEKKPCLVSNLSQHGAKVTLLSRHDLPVEFTLSVSGVERRSQIVWQTYLSVGVEFAP
jgi:hypothetical protein